MKGPQRKSRAGEETTHLFPKQASEKVSLTTTLLIEDNKLACM